MGRRIKCTDALADYDKYVYYLKGKGKKKSLYRARRRTGTGKKPVVRDVVDNKPGDFFYAKPNGSGKLCVYSVKVKRRRSRKRSSKRRRSRR